MDRESSKFSFGDQTAAVFNSANSLWEDAAIKASLNNARAQAALYYDDNNRTYEGVCTELAQFGVDDDTCADDDDSWVAALDLTTGYYCVDSEGAAVENASGTASGIVATGSCG